MAIKLSNTEFDKIVKFYLGLISDDKKDISSYGHSLPIANIF